MIYIYIRETKNYLYLTLFLLYCILKINLQVQDKQNMIFYEISKNNKYIYAYVKYS